MKTKVLSTLLVVLAVAANVQGGSIASASSEESEELAVVDFGKAYKLLLDSYKKMMPCGFSAWKIPPLAPLRIDDYKFKMDEHNLKIDGSVSSLVINGLNNFQFIKYVSNPAENSISYDVILPEYQVLGEYDFAIKASLAGYPIDFDSAGLLNIKVKDLRVVGDVALEKNAAGTGLKISDFNIKFYVGDAAVENWNNLFDVSINQFANRWHREFFLMWVRHVDFNDLYEEYVVPRLNNMLEDVTMQKLVSSYAEMTDELDAVQCSAS